jgi:hypothetical protein
MGNSADTTTTADTPQKTAPAPAAQTPGVWSGVKEKFGGIVDWVCGLLSGLLSGIFNLGGTVLRNLFGPKTSASAGATTATTPPQAQAQLSAEQAQAMAAQQKNMRVASAGDPNSLPDARGGAAVMAR